MYKLSPCVICNTESSVNFPDAQLLPKIVIIFLCLVALIWLSLQDLALYEVPRLFMSSFSFPWFFWGSWRVVRNFALVFVKCLYVCILTHPYIQRLMFLKLRAPYQDPSLVSYESPAQAQHFSDDYTLRQPDLAQKIPCPKCNPLGSS